MNPEEAERLISLGEGQRIEFKATFAEEDEAIRSLCAFANAEGGTVFFGVGNDATLQKTSLGQNTLENFAHKLRSNTQPLLTPVVEQLVIHGVTVVVAQIPKAARGQLFYAFNAPYIRVGKTNLVMAPDQQRARLREEEDLPTAQPISSVLNGVIRGPNIFIKIQNTDNQSHQFKVVLHDVTGAAGNRRVRPMWLPWNCGDFQVIGPKQSAMIQVAQADGEDRNVGKVIRFIHDKGKAYNGRLSEYVAFGGELHLELEIQSDAEFGIQAKRQWTLVVDGNGTPVNFTSS